MEQNEGEGIANANEKPAERLYVKEHVEQEDEYACWEDGDTGYDELATKYNRSDDSEDRPFVDAEIDEEYFDMTGLEMNENSDKGLQIKPKRFTEDEEALIENFKTMSSEGIVATSIYEAIAIMNNDPEVLNKRPENGNKYKFNITKSCRIRVKEIPNQDTRLKIWQIQEMLKERSSSEDTNMNQR